MNNETRYALRVELENAGCSVAGYDRNGFQVQIKRGKFCDVSDLAQKRGLRLREGSLNYFPLGSDNPPVEFRHHCGRYTPANGFNDPGFWLYATFETVSGECLVESESDPYLPPHAHGWSNE